VPMLTYALIVSGAATALSLLAQDTGPRGRPSASRAWPGTIVFPRAGTPLSLEVVESGPSGFAAVRTISRDASGRVRIDPLPGVGGNLALVTDPVAGVMIVLDKSSGTASVAHVPGLVPSGGEFSLAYLGPSARVDSLGEQVIDGVEYRGERTHAEGDGTSLATVEERWFSRELAIVGLVRSSDAAGERSARVRNLKRDDPDPGLFVVPASYTIREAN
jgi:hypothetical protein